MDWNIMEALLDRYLKNETSQEENELIENWLQENDNPHSQWQHYNQGQKDQWLENVVFTKIKHSIEANEPKIAVISHQRSIWRSVAAVAAIFFIGLMLYLEWPILQYHLLPTQLTILEVPTNQQKKITLADGSFIWINGNSQLRYPKQFTGNVREVYLSGEAFFDIHHDEKKPFIIHTGKVITTVLGTAFDIKEDKIKHTILVTVTRGRVSVANGKKQLGIITPRQQISLNLLDNKSTRTVVDIKQAISWQKRELHFEDITFAEAALELEQRFRIKINFSNDKIKNCRFTGTALKGEKLEKILKVICAFNNATYQTKSDKSIMIDGAGCN
ncbi:FecR family protein [Pedobacter sp. D749]|uniref:FecR family protein n=1 Tax=Pedobacter sp. D749 TaxID=2856523 RepID=UPI001C581FCA|nr:FecR family protein [Pedobacter sp. D749]QXU43286.1 FecR domain-containing protein [Pedobacter sp. D749]